MGKTLRFSGLKALKFNSFLMQVTFIALFLTLLVSLIFVKTVWSNDNVIINEVELNPIGNDNYSTVYGKEKAIDKCEWMTHERKAFIKTRFPYWEKWAAKEHKGTIKGDRE